MDLLSYLNATQVFGPFNYHYSLNETNNQGIILESMLKKREEN